MDHHNKNDGHPFGLAAGTRTNCMRLSRHDGAVLLHGIRADGTEKLIARADLIDWMRIEDTVKRDFNQRLLAKGEPLGKFPSEGGEVYVKTYLGREIALAMNTGSYSTIFAQREYFKSWMMMGEKGRAQVWRTWAGGVRSGNLEAAA